MTQETFSLPSRPGSGKVVIFLRGPASRQSTVPIPGARQKMVRYADLRRCGLRVNCMAPAELEDLNGTLNIYQNDLTPSSRRYFDCLEHSFDRIV